MTYEDFVNGMGVLYEPEPNTGCWLWLCGTSRGYGCPWIDGRNQSAPRLMWSVCNGPVPDGLWVLHKCDTPLCVNPSHLFLGTQLDNLRDRDEKGRGIMPDNRGEAHGMAKLTEGMVREIRCMLIAGALQRDIARQFGVRQQQISRINRGTTWRYLV